MTHDCRTVDDGEAITSIQEQQRPLQSCTELRAQVVLKVALRTNVLHVGAIPFDTSQSIATRGNK